MSLQEARRDIYIGLGQAVPPDGSSPADHDARVVALEAEAVKTHEAELHVPFPSTVVRVDPAAQLAEALTALRKVRDELWRHIVERPRSARADAINMAFNAADTAIRELEDRTAIAAADPEEGRDA